MTKFEELQSEHENMLRRLQEPDSDPRELVEAVSALVEKVRQEAEFVASPRQRDQLRANLRFWATFLFDHTGSFPPVSLRPARAGLETEEPVPSPEPAPAPPSPLPWWRGTAGVAGILIALLVVVTVVYTIINLRLLRSTSAVPETIIQSQTVTTDPTEMAIGEQPVDYDYDGDGLADEDEEFYGTDPEEADTDRDGLEDGQEIEQGSNPLNPDTDGDGILDGLDADPGMLPTNTQVALAATPTPDARTATVAALFTQAAAIVSPIPTATEGFLLPTTGGGGGPGIYLRELLAASYGASDDPPGCTSASLELSFEPGELITAEDFNDLQISLRQVGSGRILGNIPLQQGQLQVSYDLRNTKLPSGSYLVLQPEHPSLTVAAAIVRYDRTCSPQAQVLYSAVPHGSWFESEPPRSPDISLDWHVLTWGPSPDPFTWLARLSLQGQGGDGEYIYWNMPPDGYDLIHMQTLSADQSILIGWECSDGLGMVGVTSAGQTVMRDIVLLAPYCMPVPPTKTPTITPSPTLTPTPTTTSDATFTPTGTLEVLSTEPFYEPAANMPAYISNIFYPDRGCDWAGVGGQVFGLDGQPEVGIILRLVGELAGEAGEMVTLSGTSVQLGQSGFMFELGQKPLASKDALYLQLFDQGGLPLSEQVYFDTYDDCERNLVLVNFEGRR